MKKHTLRKKLLPLCISSGLFSGMLLSGCSNNDSSSSNNTLNIDVNSAVTASMSENNTSVLEAEVSVAGSQSSNAALFTVGADIEQTLATITAINYPNISGVTFTQVIPNGSESRDCTVDLTFSNDLPNCILKVSIGGSAGTEIDDQITIVTDVQTLDIQIETQIVTEGSTALPQGQINTTPTVAPDTTVQVKVTNPSTNTESFNNLSLTIPAWLYNLASNFQGGTVSTNEDGSKTITYTTNGLNQNLAPGQTHTFSFDLSGDSSTVDTLLEHYDELINNASTGVLTVNAANLRNPIKPTLTVSVTPVSMTEAVTLSDPDAPQTTTLTNLSNSELKINAIDSSNLPIGVSISGGTCVVDGMVEPAGDVGDSCTVILDTTVSAVPEDNKSLTISYIDPQSNDFDAETAVTIGGAEISVDLTSIELPVSGDQTTNVSIENTGDLNWTPSSILANYQISVSGQSVDANNISVTNGSGTNCLAGAAVSPAGACNIGIQTTAGNVDPNDDTAPGNYVLSIFPANNLTSTSTTNFAVTEPSLGAFQFQNGEGSGIEDLDLAINVAPVTITVANVGGVDITGFDLSIPEYFTQANNTCADIAILQAESSCAVDVSIAADSGKGNGSYPITASGNEGTVEGPSSLTVTPLGAVVSIESITAPVANTNSPVITELTITNNGADTITWIPSTDVNDYGVSVTGGGGSTDGITVVDPNTGDYCLDDTEIPEVTENDSCTIGIQTTNAAAVDDYTLTLELANNLANQQTQDFDIVGALGYFSFSPSSITVGTGSTAQSQTVTLRNDGPTEITNVYLDFTLPDGFTLPTNNCGISDDKLANFANGANCTFSIAANNDVDQASTVTIRAVGDGDTVENNNQAFITNIDGVVVQISAISDINRSAAGSQTTNIQITNLSDIDWTPSDDANNYDIAAVEIEQPITYPSIVDADGETNCLDSAAVIPGNSCYVGIQTVGENSTSLGNYTLTVLADENLPQNSNPADFTIIGSLGYLTYSDDQGTIEDITLTIGGDAETITLTNIGETSVTGILVNQSAQSANFNASDNCNGELAVDGTCNFTLAVNDGIAASDYTFTTTGTSSDNGIQADLEVTAEEAVVAECTGDNPTCRVFVTNSTGTGRFSTWDDTNLDGIAGANEICAAEAADMPAIADNADNFKAYISVTDTAAPLNIGYGDTIKYIRVTGETIADPGVLIPGGVPTLDGPITDNKLYAFTGTNAYGNVAGVTCNNWATSNAATAGNIGYTNSTDGAWTAAKSATPEASCAGFNNGTSLNHLICFETPPPEPYCTEDNPTCRVFVTNSTGPGKFSEWTDISQDGIPGANEICAEDANNPGGNFKAWVSTDTVNAKDNINYGATITYVRTNDTNTIIADPGTLLTTDITPLQNTITSAYVYIEPFTGTQGDGTVGVPPGFYDTYTCSNWTSSSGGNVRGINGQSWQLNSAWTSQSNKTCDQDLNIMCFESPTN